MKETLSAQPSSAVQSSTPGKSPASGAARNGVPAHPPSWVDEDGYCSCGMYVVAGTMGHREGCPHEGQEAR